MTSPRVSVLLPVYNAQATLPRALQSVRAQTLTAWELLAVDDGSTDGSGELLRVAALADPRVRVVSRTHAGLVDALNAGLALAQAPVIARLDADDECHPERLQAQLEFLAARPEIGLVGTQVEFVGGLARGDGYAAYVDWLNALVEPADIDVARFVESPFAHPSVAFRRELVERLGGYRNGDFPEDYELWLRWLEQGVRMAKIPQALVRWHDTPGRLSRTDTRYAPDAFYRVKAGYLARWWARRGAEVGESRPLWAWGAGRLTRRRIEHLERAGAAITGFIDIDPRKLGRRRDGRLVISPEALPEPEAVFVLGFVANRGARELQRAHLQQRGFVEGRDFLFAA